MSLIFISLCESAAKKQQHIRSHSYLCAKSAHAYAIDCEHKCAAISVRSKSNMRRFPFRSHSDICSGSAVQGRNTIEAIWYVDPTLFPVDNTYYTRSRCMGPQHDNIETHRNTNIRNAIYKYYNMPRTKSEIDEIYSIDTEGTTMSMQKRNTNQ